MSNTQHPSGVARRPPSMTFTLRPALQSNCRKCHSPIDGAFGYCWLCSRSMAGVRWSRLAFHVGLVAALAGTAATIVVLW